MDCPWLVPLLGVCSVGVCSMTVGCGTPAAPAPPSLNLPAPVENLSASRIGDAVQLAWTMPARTTDKVVLRHPVTVGVCRAVGDGACTSIGSLTVDPGKPGAYTDDLPPELVHGPDRLLHYEIDLLNHAAKSAGPSNLAFSAAGASPAALRGLSAQMRREGVQLGWQPVSVSSSESHPALLFRIRRLRLITPELTTEPTTKPSLGSISLPAAETLVVRSADGRDPGHAVDTSALMNQHYRYVVERVATPVFGEKSIEVQGLPSEPVAVTTTDSFPPGVPQGLAAVADEAGGAIDLSWIPDGDSDLKTYDIYRRDVRGGGAAQRLASVGLETSFRDTTPRAEHRYAYSLSAVDQSGNESQRSAEVEETLAGRSTAND